MFRPSKKQERLAIQPERFVSLLVTAAVGLVAHGFAQAAEPLLPLPAPSDLDPKKVAIGKALFADTRLSKDDTIACASCHDLSTGGADNKPLSIGVGGARGAFNTPSVFNSSLNFRQFWDGRAGSLEEQTRGPIHDPNEMATSWNAIVNKLSKDGAFVATMAATYPDGVNQKNLEDAIATYERSLVTPSRFDRWLRGDETALNGSELQGYSLFKQYGCVACHQGVNVGGNMFQVFGVMGDYFAKRGNPTPGDLGRYNVTKRDSDKHVFKVPSLRNVALTAPYFHDGSAATLPEAVDVMFRYQLGRTAPTEDRDLIVKFLQTLTRESNVPQTSAAR